MRARKKAFRKIKYNKTTSIYYLIFVFIVGVYFIFSQDKAGMLPAVSTSEDTVTILNVGQADSSLISSGGNYCLIDAAGTEDGTDDVVSYLKKAGIKEIDLFVITHFHSDHMSDALKVLNSFKVNSILIPKLTEENMPTTQFFSQFLDKVEQDKIKLHTAVKNDSFTVGSGKITIVDDTINTIDVNNTSIATLFEQDGFSYLNTGDGEKEYELQLAKVLTDKVTLFKAGHHGSKTSSTMELLEVIQPSIVAISAGKDNTYGHPHKEAMARINKTGAKIDITYRDGTLIYSIATRQRITSQINKN